MDVSRENGLIRKNVAYGMNSNMGNIGNDHNIGNTPPIVKRNSNQPGMSIGRRSSSTEKTIASNDKNRNDSQTTVDTIEYDTKQDNRSMQRNGEPGNDDTGKNPTKYKARLRKGGRIPWWHKLIDDTVRNDKESVKQNLNPVRFQQRSSGHGAQGSNNRHIMKELDHLTETDIGEIQDQESDVDDEYWDPLTEVDIGEAPDQGSIGIL